MPAVPYVHGYTAHENARLEDQASALVELLHADTAYPAGSSVLEVGCGVGAQTVTLARRSPEARITAIDRSAESLAQAREKIERAGITNVEFRQADIFALPFAAASFDHVFVCFVLEHLSQPLEALLILKKLLRPGGTITVIEGDHGSAYFYPESADADAAIEPGSPARAGFACAGVVDCLIRLQREAGGNSLIGRQLYPLLAAAGFGGVRVSPRMVYVDGSRPDLADAITRKTFTAMIAGVRDAAIARRLITAERFDAGIRALHRAAEPDGTFCYTFFKGVGERE
jgi:SAM-dependent methyltransferase